MFKRESSVCHRCGSVLLPSAEVCSTCCAPQDRTEPQSLTAFSAPAPTPEAVSAPAPTPEAVAVPAPRSEAPQTGLSAWPFGAADAEAAAQVAAREVSTDVRTQLGHYSSAPSTTHVLSAIPAQRAAYADEDLQSVPSVGPNPFLAAARLQRARDEAAAGEGYPA